EAEIRRGRIVSGRLYLAETCLWMRLDLVLVEIEELGGRTRALPAAVLDQRAVEGPGLPLQILQTAREVGIGHARPRAVDHVPLRRSERPGARRVRGHRAEASCAHAGQQHPLRAWEGRHQPRKVQTHVGVADERLRPGDAGDGAGWIVAAVDVAG